jgi:hypothetical protein
VFHEFFIVPNALRAAAVRGLADFILVFRCHVYTHLPGFLTNLPRIEAASLLAGVFYLSCLYLQAFAQLVSPDRIASYFIAITLFLNKTGSGFSRARVLPMLIKCAKFCNYIAKSTLI